ncbi:MAG TPA: hypothetical protein VFY14_01020 [Streptomyces sp.]|nr:hypothetical protein [Streptomyces sp.]
MHHPHPEAHLYLHRCLTRSHSADSRWEAPIRHRAEAVRPGAPPVARARLDGVRHRIGWTLVEAGLRLVHSARTAAQP